MNVPRYPLIHIFCHNVGSLAYYIKDEVERAESVNAPRDTYAAGSINGKPQISRWSGLPKEAMTGGESYRDKLARQCFEKYGVYPLDLLME